MIGIRSTRQLPKRMRRRQALMHTCLIGIVWATAGAAFGAGKVVEVSIVDYKFDPPKLQIKVGETVKWTNREKRTTHSVLFTGPGGFESERFFPDEAWQRRFDKAGSFPYSCGPHPEMKGLIEVAD